MKAVTLNNFKILLQSEEQIMFSRFATSHDLAVENKFTSDCDFLHSLFISAIASVVAGSSFDKGFGQQSLGNESQLGPCHQ